MVMKFNTKVEFCGSERKFQRCANRELKDYQKTLEDIQDKVTPLAERTRDFNFQLNELNDELNIIDKHIELLDKLIDFKDEQPPNAFCPILVALDKFPTLTREVQPLNA